MRNHKLGWMHFSGLVKSFAYGLLGLGGFLIATNCLQAQSTTNDSIVQITAEAQGLTIVPPDQLPRVGTYWLIMPAGKMGCISVPMPTPFPTLITYQVADGQFIVDGVAGEIVNPQILELQAAYVVNLINQIQGTQAAMQMRTAMGTGFPGLPGFGGGGGGDGGDTGTITNYPHLTINSNLLWLQITNVFDGTVYANLYEATDQVYAIWSTTNLSLPFNLWQVETEVWPTDTNCTPFNVQASGRDTLFLQAQDWTGVCANGLPCWWTWQYFGDLNESASDLDSQGLNTLGYDYTNSLDPNIISFSVRLGNRHFNAPIGSGQYTVSAGTPSYEAVLVNDANFNNAVWQTYDGTASIKLSSTDGVYQVWMGLKGRAPDSTPNWIGTTVYLDQTVPVVTITNPVGGTVALPYIQLQGFANERLAGVTYDLSNALGVVTGQAGTVTGEFLDTNLLAFTTNYFRCMDVWLANGVNVITVHATDLAGNVGSTSISYMQEYSSKTNPPVIQLGWPADGMQIGQSNMTVYGTLDDPTAAISLQVTDDMGDTNFIAGVVERDGHFWIQNVPLAGTTDVLTLTAQDVLSNTASISLTAYPANDAGLTMDPVTSDLWESTATVTGTIADDSYAVTVNGVEATNNGDGSWTANGVPVTDGNVAVFNAQAVTPDQTNMVQQVTVKQASLKLATAVFSDETMSDGVDATTAWQWTAGKGGGYQLTTHYSDGFTSWAKAVLLPNRMVASVYYTNSAGDSGYGGIYDGDQYSGGWQSDFPQVVGALNAIDQTGTTWENKSGNPSWVLHAGNLDLYGATDPDSLMVLSAGATEEVPAGGIITGGPSEFGPEIDNTGGQEDTNYLTGLVMQDGTDKKSTVTTDRPLASVPNGKGQYKPVHMTRYPALTDTNLARLNVGVGEYVDFSDMPNDTIWTTGGGGLSAITNSGTTFTAPSNATPAGVSVTVTATWHGIAMPTIFTVFPPNGYDSTHTYITTTYTNDYPIDFSAASMGLHVCIAPTDVCLNRVQIFEVQPVVTNVIGYYTNYSSLVDPKAEVWSQLDDNNSETDTCDSGIYNPPWVQGSFSWIYLVNWKVSDNGQTNMMSSGWTQSFEIDGNGTVTLTKYNLKVERNTNNVVIPSL